MRLRKIHLAILGLMLANVIWGASFPIYKWALEVLPLFSFVFLRFFIGALILLPFVYKDLKIKRENINLLLLLGLVSVTFQIPLLFWGLKLSPSINAPIIIASGPIFLLIASVIFLNEKLRSKLLTGMLISLIGIMAIILRPLIESGGIGGGILGNLLIFLATLCSVAQAVILKKLMKDNKPLVVTFWMFIIGTLPLLPAFLVEQSHQNMFAHLGIQGTIGLLYGIIFAAVAAHALLAFGIKYIKASDVGIFSYVDPIVTIIVAVPLLGETITPAYLVGAMLVFLGIFIAEGRLPYHPIQKIFTKITD